MSLYPIGYYIVISLGVFLHAHTSIRSSCILMDDIVVDDGAILDVQFTDFSYPPPDGFDRIMFEKSIL